MPKKKSIKKAAKDFIAKADAIVGFVAAVQPGASEDHLSWIHDYAVIRLYREFEVLLLKALVGAINNDTDTIAATTGVRFPKHLSDEVCEFLVIGDRYFDFKGRDGLVRNLKRFVPDTHYLVSTVKKPAYKDPIERLCALRNFAAHLSSVSRQRAKTTLGVQNLSSAGAWLKKQNRFTGLVNSIKALASDLEGAAPY